MPHVTGHGGSFDTQYAKQVANTENRRVGLENTKTFQQIKNEANANSQLNQIVNNKGNEGFSTQKIDPNHNFGKRTGKFNNVRDKLLKSGFNSLNEAEKSIARFYMSSAPSEYQGQMQRFIDASPANRQAYKNRFGAMGNFNLFMTEIPEKLAEKTMIGNIISSIGNAKDAIVDKTQKFLNIGTEDEPNIVSASREPYDYKQFVDPNFRDPIMNMVSADSTNIEEIKDTKDKTKQRINMNNLDETYNIESGMLLNNFRNVMNKGIANSSALPPNFAETFEKLKDTNQLTSGDILKSQSLLRDIVPVNNQTNNQFGIINALPSETDLALGLNLMPTLEDLQNNPAVNTMQNVYKRLSDDQGLDIDLQNRSLQYNQPMFGGNLSLTGNLGDNTGASLMFSKAI